MNSEQLRIKNMGKSERRFDRTSVIIKFKVRINNYGSEMNSLRISHDLPWGGYGYFLELHIVKFCL